MADISGWLEEGYVPAFRSAYLILGNRSDAEEAVQDAFLRAWRFRDAIGDDASVKSWLYRVVVNACYSKLRREIPHRDRRVSDDELDSRPGRSGDPENAAERGELADQVFSALATLPSALRVPIVLRYYADLSEKEIARVIRRRPGTVKSRLHEARRRLAQHPGLRALVIEDGYESDGTQSPLRTGEVPS